MVSELWDCGWWKPFSTEWSLATQPLTGLEGGAGQNPYTSSFGDMSVDLAFSYLSIAGELHELGRHSFCCLAALEG